MKAPAPAKGSGPGRRSTGHRSGHTTGSTKKTPQKTYTKAQNRAFRKYIRQQRRAGLPLEGLPDCTFTAAAELAYMQTGFRPSDQAVAQAFLDTGPADRGRFPVDALAYWRDTGIDGHKIKGFWPVSVFNHLEGPLYLSLVVPCSAVEQFHAGEIWDDVGDQRIIDHHTVAYRDGHITTWGRVQEVTPAFLRAYINEAWMVF